MASSRRERIEAMLVDEPNDSFLRYGLALELAKEGENDRSLALLEGLTKDSPPYVPAFFMAAKQLVELERVSQGRSYLRSGIDAARQQGDHHAAGEMSEYLATLGGAGE